MPLRTAPALTRRRLLAATGGLGAASALAACGTGPEAPATEGDPDSGPFSFTDDRDQTAVEFDHTPSVVVAFTGLAAALYDYGVEVAAVFGPTTLADGAPDMQAGRLPVDELTVLGNVWGEFDVEAYAQLGPQLLVSHYYEGYDLWFIPEERLDEIEGLAPGIGIEVSQPTLDQIIDRHAALAVALGADLGSDANVEGVERFGAAAGAVAAAVADKPLKALAVGARADGLYIANPAAFNLLAKGVELGVDFVVPESPDSDGYWEPLSWENASRYGADLIFLDERTGNLQPEELADFPTWTSLPAVAEGQVYGWNAEPVYSHVGGAIELEKIAAPLEAARPLEG
ncbi:ABC transporter substrate-binding protein [Glycomyces sp. NRRL B-16210]|uniref:ABC transporter substrate-binding protein n=1 Tax=Glycomyces sp. NRRL B-16210 TaxID=1463821 RepID=UPI00068F03E8|nr:ABC transporter substrate-binding protein [Glycomyces sp. NRRL B-16210]